MTALVAQVSCTDYLLLSTQMQLSIASTLQTIPVYRAENK